MSFLSTMAAFAMMPFWVYMLATLAYGTSITIDFVSIVLSLMLIVIPCITGLSIRYNNTETKIGEKFIWQWIEAGTSVFGILFLILAGTLTCGRGTCLKDLFC